MFLIHLKRLPPLIGRFVPFVAIVAANMVNIPLMRSEELQHGIPVTDKDGNRLGDELSQVVYFHMTYKYCRRRSLTTPCF